MKIHKICYEYDYVLIYDSCDNTTYVVDLWDFNRIHNSNYIKEKYVMSLGLKINCGRKHILRIHHLTRELHPDDKEFDQSIVEFLFKALNEHPVVKVNKIKVESYRNG